jgi:hypothetical protein
LRELHRAVRLKPTTAHSLLRSLQAGRYVEQDAGTGHYRLGVRLLEPAGAYLRGSHLIPQLEHCLRPDASYAKLDAESRQIAMRALNAGRPLPYDAPSGARSGPCGRTSCRACGRARSPPASCCSRWCPWWTSA